MTRRTRTLAGIVTLTALAMSFGETVYASLCVSMSDMDGRTGQMAMADGPMTDQIAPSMSHCTLMSSDDASPDGDQEEVPCPLSPAVGSGCTGVASLPGQQSTGAASTPHTARPLAWAHAGPGLLLTHDLFRPPRA